MSHVVLSFKKIILIKIWILFKIYVFIILLLPLVIFFWFKKKKKIEFETMFKLKIENYEIYNFKDVINDFPHLYLYLLSLYKTPLKIVTLLLSSLFILIIKFIQFFICSIFVPFILFWILFKISVKGSVKITFIERNHVRWVDIVILVFSIIPICVCWNKTYNIMKVIINKSKKINRTNLSLEIFKKQIYYFLILFFLGTSLHTLYLIYRIHEKIYNISNITWNKKKLIKIIPRTVMRNIYRELFRYEKSYVKMAAEKKIYLDEFGSIRFNPPKITSLVLEIHAKNGNFMSQGKMIELGLKKCDVITPTGKVRSHPIILMGEEGDKLSDAITFTHSPVYEALWEYTGRIHGGRKETFVYNQVQNKERQKEWDGIWKVNEEEINTLKAKTNFKRLSESDMSVYMDDSRERVMGVFYNEGLKKFAEREGDFTMIKRIEDEQKEMKEFYYSESNLENTKLRWYELEQNSNLLNNLTKDELKITGIAKAIENRYEKFKLDQELFDPVQISKKEDII